MKESKGKDIRARISDELKAEFQDIFGDMSKKLIELVEQSIIDAKDIYLKSTIMFFKTHLNDLRLLDFVIDSFYSEVYVNQNEDIINILDNIKNSLSAKYEPESHKIISIIYKDIINGLYFGSKKDTLKHRVERLYRNKNKIHEYIQINM